MSDEVISPVGSGQVENQHGYKADAPAAAPAQPKPEASDEWKTKILKEKQNAMTALRDAEAKLKEQEQRIALAEEEKLRAKEDYKGIAELRVKEAEEWKSKYNERVTADTKTKKLAAISKELKKMGASDKGLDFLLKNADLEYVKYDDEHKVVLGAEDVARSIKDQAPEMFGRSQGQASHEAPQGPVANVDMEAWNKMSADDKRKFASNPENLKLLFGSSVR